MPDLHRAISGQAAGVSLGALLVVRGADFPARLFGGRQKTWAASLYGASVTADDGVIVMGGRNAERNFRDVFWLRRRD